MRGYDLAFLGVIALAIWPAAAGQTVAPSAVKPMAVSSDAKVSDDLIGSNLVDKGNNPVGEIRGFVIERGSLTGYVLSVGDFLGTGERYVAVSPTSVALTWDDGARKWKGTINATREQLKGAPAVNYDDKVRKPA